jgi:hypothetical protein
MTRKILHVTTDPVFKRIFDTEKEMTIEVIKLLIKPPNPMFESAFVYVLIAYNTVIFTFLILCIVTTLGYEKRLTQTHSRYCFQENIRTRKRDYD